MSPYRPNLWDEDYLEPTPGQLELFPAPVLHDQPEPAPPQPGPIRRAQLVAEDEGWIPQCSLACLYVSAGGDTRPLTYLRHEVLTDAVVSDWIIPEFFVFVDRDLPGSDGDMDLYFDDGRTRVQTVEQRPVESASWERAALLRVVVTSDRFPIRECAVLRIRSDTEGFCQDALAEDWSPDWFIGICDGCAFGGNDRCENELDRIEQSIPLRLRVRFWLTDHLARRPLLDEDGYRLHRQAVVLPIRSGGLLRGLHSWRLWPGTGHAHSRWVSLFRVEPDVPGT